MEASPVGLRERKKERVREQLVDAAMKLFARDGYDETTVDDIVRAVEVSRRTFFRYFACKEDVVMAWIDGHRQALRALLDSRPADEPPLVSIRHAFMYLAGSYEAHRSEVLLMERIIAGTTTVRARKQESLARHARALAEVFASRLGLDAERDLEPQLLGRVAIAAAAAAFDTWIAGGAKASLPKLVEEAIGWLERGAPPGRVKASTESPRAKAPRKR